MIGNTRRGAKTENLSLRLDPKTKFMLEFVSRVKGQNITMVVEHAIREVADASPIGVSSYSQDNGPNWRDFWDASEGTRVLKLISCRNYPTTFDEDELYEFTRAHGEFFFSDVRATIPKRAYVDILWPRINQYLEIWRNKKASEYWAAGEAMKQDIRAAGLQPPEWPRQPCSEPPKAPKVANNRAALDDEIPF